MSCDPAATWLRFARDAPADVNLTRISLVDREGQNLASMARSCTLLFAAGAAVCSDGVLVELGTWAGGSFTSNGTTNNVTISSGNGTLEGIAASINDADIGVTASIVK